MKNSISLLLFAFVYSFAAAQGVVIHEDNTRRQTSASSSTSFQHSSDSDFLVVSSLNVGGTTISLEKKNYSQPTRTNSEGTLFYKTSLAVGFRTGNDYTRDILDTELYTEWGLVNENLPCMLIDPVAQKMFVFANSKQKPGKRKVDKNAMEGIVYALDMNTGKWTRKTVFQDTNWGWYSFFGGSDNGEPTFWHYSYKDNQVIGSVYISGMWGNLERGRYPREAIRDEYPHHRNILVASTPDVDRMAGAYPLVISGDQFFNKESSRTSSGDSDRALRTGVALAGTAVLAYGVFKLLTSGMSSTSSSYYSGGGSYSNSSSSSNSNSSSRSISSSSSSAVSQTSEVDVERIGIPSYEWVTDWYHDSFFSLPGESVTNEQMENQGRKIKFPGVGTGKIVRVVGSNGYWSSRRRYKTLEDAIIAEYVYLKYGKIRQTGRYN